MDFRKIQSTAGGATSIVSLPRSWIKKNNLQQSDEIGIIERKDGVLFLNHIRVYPRSGCHKIQDILNPQ